MIRRALFGAGLLAVAIAAFATSRGQAGARKHRALYRSVDVDGLKTAGFPLVMSFSDDQRRELKSLAHLLGLESVISGF